MFGSMAMQVETVMLGDFYRLSLMFRGVVSLVIHMLNMTYSDISTPETPSVTYRDSSNSINL
jgi:hypothetical protein